MIRGSFDSETLLDPLMRTRDPLPVVPPASCTTTPGARDDNTFAMLVTAAAVTCCGTLMFAVATPLSRRVCSWPVAVTWTTSSCVAAISRVKSTVAVSLAPMVIGFVIAA